MQLEIHRLTKDRLEDVKFLAKEALGFTYDLEYLSYKYDTLRYCDYQNMCCIGYVDDKPVGFYGALPAVFRHQEEEVLFCQTCDSYTLPSYQGKGIHKRLAEATYDLMKTYGAKGVFAFHSENTFESCKKLGWSSREQLNLIQINTPYLIPWLKILDKFTVFDNYSKKRVTSKLSDFKRNSVISNAFCDEFFGVKYDERLVKYKSRYNCHLIEIDGCKLWLKIKSIIYVGAIEGLNKNNCHAIIKGLKLLAKRLGTDKIIFELEMDHSAFPFLNNEFGSRPAFKIGYLCFDEAFDFSRIRLNFVDLDNFL